MIYFAYLYLCLFQKLICQTIALSQTRLLTLISEQLVPLVFDCASQGIIPEFPKVDS